jgi:hypothetical protein
MSQGPVDSIEDLVALWRLATQSDAARAEDLESIQRGIADADAGCILPAANAFADARQAVLSKQ